MGSQILDADIMVWFDVVVLKLCWAVAVDGLALRVGCDKGFDTGPPPVGAGSLSFCAFSWFWIVFLGLPAGLPFLPALF